MGRDCLLGFYIIGYQKRINWREGYEEEVPVFGDLSDLEHSFEEYLLKTRVGFFKKLRAKIFQGARLGVFKPLFKDYDWTTYYLIWCRVHKKYVANYLRGEDESAFCPKCDEERRKQISKS